MSDSSDRTPLERGQLIPAFNLPGSDNLPYSPWAYKQREHLLLLFLHSSQNLATQTLLRTFAASYKAFREEQSAILAITADPVIHNMATQEELHLPYPLLSDPQGTALTRYTLWNRTTGLFRPSIVLADRYNALYQQWQADNETGLPAPIELLESLQYLNHLCTS